MSTSSHPLMRFMASRLFTVLAVGAMALGAFMLLQPTVASMLHERKQVHEITVYDEAVAELDAAGIEATYDKASAYNASLPSHAALYTLSPEEQAAYEAALDPAETGVMGHISIPALELTLPIYHGTSDAEMLKGACHVEGTALPLGETSTHAAITAHRGEPGASYFKDLDRLAQGDTFSVTVLDRVSTYEVDRIVVVEPQDFAELDRIKGESLCTLITCTPYGVNSHRLLVRGRLVETRPVG